MGAKGAAARRLRRGRCGVRNDCPPLYTAGDVTSSALRWNPQNETDAAVLRACHKSARHACGIMGPTEGAFFGQGIDGNNATLRSGGWCLPTRTEAAGDAYSTVSLPHSQSYFLPYPHVAADLFIIHLLRGLLKICSASCIAPMCKTCPSGWRYLSVNDFGAGVGQYGRALLSDDPRYRWSGYDGAGNIEEATGGFVRFFDLSIPLSQPRADWVLSLEVGEHLPRVHEQTYIRNLHAHNCHGIVLSWAPLGKWGVGHHNTHSQAYLLNQFSALGYRLHNASTEWLRKRHSWTTPQKVLRVRNVSHGWHWLRGAMMLQREVPLRDPACTAPQSATTSQPSFRTRYDGAKPSSSGHYLARGLHDLLADMLPPS